MTDHGGAASPRTDLRIYQCPGCWSVTTNPMTEDGYECDCGERLFRIDLRDTEPSPFQAAQEVPAPEGLRAALDAVESRHRQGDWTEEGWVGNSVNGSECSGCGEHWPCSAERLRATLAAAPSTPAEPPRSVYQEGWRDGTLDRLGLAEARPPEGLDADRLARAMARLAEVGPPAHLNPDDAEEHWPSYLDEATDLAAEYARLSAGGDR